ncbi:unnamed protein product, partial [Strongylus vulgaris]
QLKVLDECGCGDPRFPLPSDEKRYCSAKSVTDRVDCPAVLDIFNDTEACTEYYRVNTAYIEIYYEQLNFETLRETAGYTVSTTRIFLYRSPGPSEMLLIVSFCFANS